MADREPSLRGRHMDAYVLDARRELFRWHLMRAHTQLKHFPQTWNETTHFEDVLRAHPEGWV